MKQLHSKKQNKIIVLILAVIMLCNFVMPQKVHAVTTGNGLYQAAGRGTMA